MKPLTATLETAIRHHQAGRVDEARTLYKRILRSQPNQPDALHLLGLITFQRGGREEGIGLVERAVARRPAPDYHNNLGQMYFSAKRPEAALGQFEAALRLRPSHREAQWNRAMALRALGRGEEAIEALDEYRAKYPEEARALLQLGHALAQAGRREEARDLYQEAARKPDWLGQLLPELGAALAALGDPAAAAACFKRFLERQPEDARARNALANALLAQGRCREAIEQFEAVLARDPGFAEAWNGAGVGWQQLGEAARALACFERAVECRPEFTEAVANLGHALNQAGRYEEAIPRYRRALELEPAMPDVLNNLGHSLVKAGRLEEAEAAFRAALEQAPSYIPARANLGQVLYRRGRHQEALGAFEAALVLDPSAVGVLNDLGILLSEMGRPDEAIPTLERALSLAPNYVDTLVNLAAIERASGKLVEAARHGRRALELRPGYAEAWNNLGGTLTDLGEVEEGTACFRRAFEERPDYHHAFSNYLLNLHYLAPFDPEAALRAHREFGARFGRVEAHPPRRDLSPDRRLRVGYLSHDFCIHSVAFFFEALCAHHPSDGFEVYCYSTSLRVDEVTERLRAWAGAGWRDMRGMDELRIAEQVEADAIDILVDLGGHTARNSLLALAARPAPVQMSWLGYPDTTGLPQVQYRLSDAWADPPGLTERWHTEELVRLGSGFLCYRPAVQAPPVGPPPSAARDTFVFGCFNHLPKLNREVLETWAEILDRRPGSLLLVKSKGLANEPARERILATFEARGVDPRRICLAPPVRGIEEHLALYGQVDLALDPFPYHGTTTTCEALWMGAPVVSLAGGVHLSRVGVSLLGRAGLEEFLADSREDYICRAVEWSRRPDALVELRATMRDRLRASALMDGPGFARSLEDAYREAWCRWTADRA